MKKKLFIILLALVTVFIPNISFASNLFWDYFTGTIINTLKWSLTNPNSIITQNNVLDIANPHTGTISLWSNYLSSVSTITPGIAVAQSNLTWTTDSVNEALGGLYLFKDSSNYADIVSRTVAGGKYRLQIYTGGVNRYDIDTTITKGKDVKIVYNSSGTTVSFYYWSGSVWTQMGTTQIFNIGSPLHIGYTTVDASTFTGANPIIIDNAYLSDADYSNQYPPLRMIIGSGISR